MFLLYYSILLIKVLLIVRETYPGFQLAIMGRGDVNEEKKLSNAIKELNLFDNVQVLGYLEGLEKFNILKTFKIPKSVQIYVLRVKSVTNMKFGKFNTLCNMETLCNVEIKWKHSNYRNVMT